MGASEQGAQFADGRWLAILRTLCFVLNGDDVLLMRRAAHKRVFPNRYNGVGGHLERHEDPLTGVRREVLEETGLHVFGTTLRAVYNIDAGDANGIVLFVFTAWSDTREVTPNDEGTLHWISRNMVNQFDLVEDLPIILPRVLQMDVTDSPLFVHVSYDDDDCILLRFAE